MAVILRIFIGMILLGSGVEKLLSPYQNFLYVIQSYQMLPSQLEFLAAVGVPWIELVAGLFMLLGLWLNLALLGAVGLFSSFIIIVGQALIRHLPIDHCGCFGEALHIAPQ